MVFAPPASAAESKLVLRPAVSQATFGTVTEGSTSRQQRFFFRNAGRGWTGDVDVELNGGDEEDFRVTFTNCGRSLRPGARCEVRLAFRPKDDGKRDTKLEVDPDNGSKVSLRLVGTGRASQSASLVFAPAVQRTDFGTVARGSASGAKRFFIRNSGQQASGDVEVDLAGGDDDSFQIAYSNCGKSLNPGARCEVRVRFRPKDDGKLDARLQADPDRGSKVSTTLVGVGSGGSGGSGGGQDDDDDDDDSSAPTPCRRPGGTPPMPSSVLNLTNWKLTLPTDGCDSNEWADEVTQPDLASFADPEAFVVHGSGRGVVFRARVDGARTSSNTKYPRSELREMTNGGRSRASWSNKSSSDGVHTMRLDAAITAVPPNKSDVVVAQIHDSADDVIMIRLRGSRLVVDADDSRTQLLLDDRYVLGSRFRVAITASSGRIWVAYNGQPAVSYPFAGEGMYFKAGCYTLSNTSFDNASAAGKAVIFALSVSHT